MHLKSSKLLKNDYLIAVVCKLATVIIGVLYSSLSARYLGPSVKGEVAYITSWVNIISIVLTVGVHQAYPYYRKQEGNASIKNKFMNCIFALFAFYALVCVLLCSVFHDGQNMIYILLLSPVFAYSRISGYVYLVESASKRNIITLMANIIRVIYVAVLFVFTKSNVMYGISVFAFVDVLLSAIYTIKLKIKFDIKDISFKFLKKVLAYGIIPMITILASTLNYRIDVLMLRYYPNVSLDAIGVYSIGVALAEEVILIPEAVKEILLSKLAKGAKEQEVAMVMRVCAPLCLIVVIGIVILGKPFINFLYGGDYIGAYQVTLITMFGVIAVMYYKMIEIYNIVNKKQLYTLIFLCTSIIVNVVVNMILIPKLDIIGAAIATLISYSYCAVVFLMYFSKRSKIKIRNLLIINKKDIQLLDDLIRRKKSADGK